MDLNIVCLALNGCSGAVIHVAHTGCKVGLAAFAVVNLNESN